MKYGLRFFLLSVVDMILLSVSGICSFVIINGSLSLKDLTADMVLWIALFILLNYAGLLLFKSYKALWRYSGLRELVRVAQSLVLSTMLFSFLHKSFFYETYPITFYFLLWMTSMFVVNGFRIIWIMGNESTPTSLFARKKALIIGAGEAGTMVAKQLLQSDKAELYPIGFIDDDLNKQKFEIIGLPIMGRRSDIPRVVKQYGIKDIIVAIPSAPKAEIGSIVTICKQTSAQIKILPRIQDLIHGRVSVKEMRDIDVSDLLGRDMIEHSAPGAEDYLRKKIVLITGAGGSIGSELVYQIAQFGPKSMILLGHGENSIYTTEMNVRDRFPHIAVTSVIADIQDRVTIEDVFKRYQPNVVFHAAAHKHVPLMELNEAAAIKNNVFGTKIVAETADKYGTERFVFISTDKAVHPVNIMGMTKRLGEMVIQQLSKTSATRFSVVRFGNVLESRGSVIPIFKKQMIMGGPVTVTHPDMVRYFMTIPEAVQLVLEAGSLSEGGEIFVLDMGEPVKIVDLARALIRLAGYVPDRDIKIEYTGIRPGEKLSESLFYEDESIIPSEHPHISIALARSIDGEHLRKGIEQLEADLLHKRAEIRDVLERIVMTREEC